MGVKEIPLSPFDPRALQGIGLHFATSHYGPHHLYAYTFIDELLNVHESLDPWAIEGKPQLVKHYQDLTAVMDSLGLCNWPLMGIRFNHLVPMVNTCLGTSFRPEELLRIGERVWNQERLFNMRCGLDGTTDRLPERFTTIPLEEGPAKGQVSRVPEMLPEYYRIRGWSAEGRPLPETLGALGLEE